MKTIPSIPLNLIALIGATLLTSCSMQKHIQKNLARTSTGRHVDSALVKTENDKTRTKVTEVITEHADTSAIIPGWTTTAPLRGGTLALRDGGFITFSKSRADSFTIVMPAKTVPFHYNKRTERSVETDQALTSKTTSRVVKKEAAQTKARVVERATEISPSLPWWLWVLIPSLLIACGYGAYRKMTGKGFFP